MSYPEIKRRTEMFLCEKLRSTVTGLTVIPFSGGDSTGDAFDIEPPFAVVAITSAERTHQTESTWYLRGTLQYISHLTEAKPQEHAMQSRLLYAALDGIAAEQQTGFSFHGLDISEITRAEDESSRARADIAAFTAGVGG